MEFTIVGENAIVLSVSYDKTRDAVHAVRTLWRRVRLEAGVISSRCGLDAILIEHTEDFDMDRFVQRMQQVSITFEPPPANLLKIPVCYDGEFGRDLLSVASATGLSVDEVIQLHTSPVYEVWMIGFMPGFPYLGELDSRLQLERKRIPDPQIVSGSVAIAEEYVGIYPFDSPGGWHVLGRTPWTMIDYSKQKPWLFDYGMQVQFYRISHDEFDGMRGKVS